MTPEITPEEIAEWRHDAETYSISPQHGWRLLRLLVAYAAQREEIERLTEDRDEQWRTFKRGEERFTRMEAEITGLRTTIARLEAIERAADAMFKALPGHDRIDAERALRAAITHEEPREP